MNRATYVEWFARYGNDYDTVEAARADYDRYVRERDAMSAIFAMDDA